MNRKTYFPPLLFALAIFALTACTSQISNPVTETASSTTQSSATRTSATPTLAVTQTPEPQETSTPSAPIETAACTGPIELTPDGDTISYKDVQFKLDPDLGFEFTVQECEAGIEDSPWGPQLYPAHLVFRSDSPLLNNFVQPEIRVYMVSGDLESYTYPLNSIDELQQMLDERPEPSPWFSGLALHTGEKYLDSHYATGVRGIVEVIQDPFFWTNNYLQYAYHGLTDDGGHFISASFPLSAPFLMDIQGPDPLTNTNPNAIPVQSWPASYEQQREIIDAYNLEVLSRFEGSSPYDFTPNFELYDALLMSLQVGVQGSPASTGEEACFTPSIIPPFAFTPDNKSILLRGMDGVRFFNLDALEEERILQAPQNINAAALSPAGDMLAWSLEDNTIQLVQVSDGKVMQTLSGHTDMVTKLRFSPGGEQLVSAAHDFSVRVWNIQGEELGMLQAGEVLGIAISPDGSTLATVPFDGPVSLWDLDTLEKIKDLSGTGGYDTSDPYFSPDGQFLAADLATGLYLWRISDGELLWNEINNSMAIAFSPDGRYLAYSVVNEYNKVFLSTSDGSEILSFMEGHQAPLWELFFSPDSRLLVSADGLEIRIWSVEDNSLMYIGKAACP